jgi:hypothetical protein
MLWVTGEDASNVARRFEYNVAFSTCAERWRIPLPASEQGAQIHGQGPSPVSMRDLRPIGLPPSPLHIKTHPNRVVYAFHQLGWQIQKNLAGATILV